MAYKVDGTIPRGSQGPIYSKVDTMVGHDGLATQEVRSSAAVVLN